MYAEALGHESGAGVGDGGAGQYGEVGGRPQPDGWWGGAGAGWVEDQQRGGYRGGREACQHRGDHTSNVMGGYNWHRTTLP
jgi:hypothetical protein